MAAPASFTSSMAIRNKRPATDDHDGTSHDRLFKKPRSDTPAQLAAQKREQSQWVIAMSESLPSSLGKRSANPDGDVETFSTPPPKRIHLNVNSRKYLTFPHIARNVVSRFPDRDVSTTTSSPLSPSTSPTTSSPTSSPPAVASRTTRKVSSRGTRRRTVPVPREAPSGAERVAAARASRFAAFYKARVATFEAAIRERRDLLDVHEAAFREVRPRPAREVALLERRARIAAVQGRPRDIVFRASRDRLDVYKAFIHSDAFREALFSHFIFEESLDSMDSFGDGGFCDIR